LNFILYRKESANASAVLKEPVDGVTAMGRELNITLSEDKTVAGANIG
jgi:hypothetical protein